MVITYQGDSYFKIQSGSFTLLMDPTNARSFKGANIVVHTKNPAPMEAPKDEEGLFWIENGGEYEVQGVRIEGRGVEQEKTETRNVYRITIEDIEIGIVGPITKEPSSEIIEDLRDIDILLAPGGEEELLPVREAIKLVRQIEPGIVIPYAKNNDVKKFFAELGQTPKPEEKLVIKKKEITRGKIQGVYLRP